MNKKRCAKLSIICIFLVGFLVINLGLTSNNKKHTARDIKQYKAFVNRILSFADVNVQFEMVPDYRVSTCYTHCGKQGMVLLYAPSFLYNAERNFGGYGFSESKINNQKIQSTNESIDWEKQGVLAHEAGHIALNHCKKYSSGSKQAEVEADIFMGKMLHMLGATLSQAQSCLYLPDVGEEESYQYPSRKQRLENVKIGWKSAGITTDKGEQELSLARRYYLAGGRKNFKKSFNLFYKNKDKEFFTHNDMYILGVMYLKGKGTKKDFQQSLIYLEKSYLHGNQKAYHLYRLFFY